MMFQGSVTSIDNTKIDINANNLQCNYGSYPERWLEIPWSTTLLTSEIPWSSTWASPVTIPVTIPGPVTITRWAPAKIGEPVSKDEYNSAL
jgi:hypothetical protein